MISALNRSFVSRLIAAAVFFLFLSTPLWPARAQPYGPDDDIDQTVARISYVQGPVSYGRGDDPDEWDTAIVNVPFTLGDRIYSAADGRAELELPGGNFVRIGRRSYLTALTLTHDTKQFYLGEGAASINLRRLDRDEIFEIDTPNVAVTLETPGKYRVEVDEDGNTRVIARQGTAVVAASGRQVTVERAEMRVFGIDSPQYETAGLGAADAFDRWVEEREDRFARSYRAAYRYANEEIVGVDDLADYGRWEEIPEYGYSWTPTRVAVGWQPFTVGHWFWQDPWGWSWISAEPWGWAPCHYGRWIFHGGRWYWVPVRHGVRVVRYAPAVVEFVRVREHVGWFPLHPRDHFVPWWSRRGRVEEATYVNRTRVVVVKEETFISSRRVTTALVGDATIIREAGAARARERLPIPRRESLRVVAERREVERPPAYIVARPIVARIAPTPTPRFDDKLRVIQERQGRPVSAQEIVELGAKDLTSNRRMQIRPADAGRGDLTPRNQGGATPTTRPVTPLKGRKPAAEEGPLVTDPKLKQESDRLKDQKQFEERQRKDEDRRRLELERQRPEKQPQEQPQKVREQKVHQQKKEDKLGRGSEQQQQDLREAARQKQIQERKQQQERKQPLPGETPRGRDGPAPSGPPPLAR
jgi:hypothetical protein